MNLRPIDDRYIIKKLDEEQQKTSGGIIIPDTAKEEPMQGKVIAVSASEEEMGDIKVGDTVIFAKYGPTEVKLGDESFLIVSRGDIQAIVAD